jgi:hypothetical protein
MAKKPRAPHHTRGVLLAALLMVIGFFAIIFVGVIAGGVLLFAGAVVGGAATKRGWRCTRCGFEPPPP